MKGRSTQMDLEAYLYHLLSQRFNEVWESAGNTCAGTLTAYVDYEMKSENKRGLFWKVKATLQTLIKDGKVIQVKKNYYPAKKEEQLSKIGRTKPHGKRPH